MRDILRWRNRKSDYEQLCDELKEVAGEMKRVRDRLNYVTDPDLVDSVIYHLKSLEKRYIFLKREAKQVRAG